MEFDRNPVIDDEAAFDIYSSCVTRILIKDTFVLKHLL